MTLHIALKIITVHDLIASHGLNTLGSAGYLISQIALARHRDTFRASFWPELCRNAPDKWQKDIGRRLARTWIQHFAIYKDWLQDPFCSLILTVRTNDWSNIQTKKEITKPRSNRKQHQKQMIIDSSCHSKHLWLSLVKHERRFYEERRKPNSIEAHRLSLYGQKRWDISQLHLRIRTGLNDTRTSE